MHTVSTDNDFLVRVSSRTEVPPRPMLPDIHRDSSPTTSPLKQYIRAMVINQAGRGVGWWSPCQCLVSKTPWIRATCSTCYRYATVCMRAWELHVGRMPADQSHEILWVACCYNIAVPWHQANLREEDQRGGRISHRAQFSNERERKRGAEEKARKRNGWMRKREPVKDLTRFLNETAVEVCE